MKRINLLFRKLWRNKLFTFLNIIGLAIGISACWTVFRIVNYEFSFDKNHPDKENIYKVYTNTIRNGETSKFDGVRVPVANFIKENIANVDLVAPEYKYYFNKRISFDQKNNPREISDQSQIFGTFKDYFTMVPYTWLAGDKNSVFNNPYEIVLTESRAKVYYPDFKPSELIGKTIQLDSNNYTISGVIQDLSHTSSFLGKEFIPVNKEDLQSDNWDMITSNHHLYVKLNNEKAKATLTNLLSKKNNEVNKEMLAKYNVQFGYGLASLDNLHFEKGINGSVDKKTLYGIIGIGSFLLLLACINYINLTTAQVPFRAKEIGIRKTLGEQPKNVLLSFLTETFIISICALLVSFPLIKSFEKYFASYFPSGINEFSDTLQVTIFLIILVILLTVFSSFYPAYLINKVQIAEVIKMKNVGKLKFGSIPLRKALIIFQFIIAQVFVIATILMGFQIQFMLNKDLGFNHNGIVTLELPYQKDKVIDHSPFLLKESLSQYKSIENVSLGHLPMSGNYFGSAIVLNSDTGALNSQVAIKYGDDNYLDLYNFKLLSGRDLQLSDTSTGIILNEAALTKIGIKEPQQAIGQTITMNEQPRGIVGIVSNFNSNTLHSNIEPLVILPSNNRDQLRSINIKLSKNTGDWKNALASIEKEWKVIYPKDVFEFRFFDEQMKTLYESDYRFSSIINLSSGITILLSCLGLIGLVTITINQRTKEIGIRKVLGSSVSRIIALLSKDYLQLVFISILIATPIAWLMINKWLEGFAYKIDLNIWLFMIPAAATLLIAFFTMFYHSLKAAKANPVDSLRDE